MKCSSLCFQNRRKMNRSGIIDRFVAWQKKSVEEMNQNNEDSIFLLKVAWLKHGDFSFYLQAFAQPPLSAFYLVLLLLLLYVLVKEKLIGFVQVILFLSNGVVVIQMTIASPLLLVIFGFFDHDVPIPYPWCAMLIIIEAHVKNIVRLTALYLKLLLAINRVCSVYYPFKYRIWFTKKKSAIYCAFVVAVCATVGVSMNFSFERFTLKPYFDDIWGQFQTYDACSMAPSEIGNNLKTMVFISHFIDLLLNLIGMIGIAVCNVLIIKRLVKTKLKNRDLRGIESTYEQTTDARMSLINRISMWVLLSCIICELPIVATYVLNLYDDILLIQRNREDKHRQYIHTIHVIEYVLLTPLDMVIFVIMSKKTRKAIKQRLCWYC